ncbi:hypothetical protein [Vibrio metoecus]|uniref:hypothetical protein n=2 Tax=Vibrio metoecus TaxID=1481663 RepID=UPI00272DC527|nr:hypothetical protein [Vibrio metoecus]WKY95296.1 hypothetical protein QYQ96_15405 [Vibrio metoecus]
MFKFFLSKNKKFVADNEVYAQAYAELESKNIHVASMARALVKAEGNQEKAIGFYIQERFESLKAEMQIKQDKIKLLVGSHQNDSGKKSSKIDPNDFRLYPTYFDPAYKRRICKNCKKIIEQGRVYCFNCKSMQDGYCE